jgi:23S rRNA (uridine2552-2'-O)-methyltransferase
MANYAKPDFWALKAQKEGYPARSVYKLKEMDEKFGLLPSRHEGAPGSFRVLDLGAAPGSWSLYVLRKLASGVFLVAVDLAPLSRQCDRGLFGRENFSFVQGDMREEKNRQAILGQGPYRLLVCDAAPATTGNRQVDTLRSLELARIALDYAEAALEKGGNLVVKVFQGSDTESLIKHIRSLFKTGRGYKPQACRSESFETYYLGLGKIH